MKKGSDAERVVSAARMIANSLPKEYEGKGALFAIIQAYESLHREHNECATRRPLPTAAPVLIPAECRCPDRVNGTKLCVTHANERLEYLNRLLILNTDKGKVIKFEYDALADSVQRNNVVVRVIPPAGKAITPSQSTKKPAKPVDPRAMRIFDDIAALFKA